MTTITEHVSDRSKLQGMNTDVDITVEAYGADDDVAIEVKQRLERAIEDEIDALAEDLEEDDG